MNRNKEYTELLLELERVPEQLEYTLQRAEVKLKSKYRRSIAIPLSSMLSLSILFVLFVNLIPSFAYACGKIPIIKELAQAAAFSPSLSAAIEEQYVQPIDQELCINGITARVEYVIVDQKQVNVFYTLKSDLYPRLNCIVEIKNETGASMEGYSIFYGDPETTPGMLSRICIDFTENNVPDHLNLVFNVYEFLEPDNPESTIGTEDSYFLEDKGDSESKYISTFTFPIRFDPYFTSKGETIVLDTNFELDGQSMILEKVEIYPTHMRVDFGASRNNSAWLKALQFYAVNEKGEKFEPIANGISATGSHDSPMMASHRLESSFFSESKELTLYITQAMWLDKDMERVKLDLAHTKAEFLPQNVTFIRAKKYEKGWILDFSAEWEKENNMYSIWNSNYYDEAGREYSINHWSSSGPEAKWDEENQKFSESKNTYVTQIPLIEYPYDIVYMSPYFSRITTLKVPIQIKIK